MIHPYVINCLNRGTIKVQGGTTWLASGLAGGMTGYCYNDYTESGNCADEGSISSDDVCAHISGSYMAEACHWSKNENLNGIYNKNNKGGYKSPLSENDMRNDWDYHYQNDCDTWIMREGHLDINIIY